MATATVLVVEDNEMVRETAVEMLSRGGYASLEAAEALEAMNILEENPNIAVMFTDVVMPGMNGFILADLAKRRRPGLRVVYATGYADMRATSAHHGVLHGKILKKPYNSEQLLTFINDTLGVDQP
ncbi:MAG TPA: response regulator [Stellaceae bacterium]|nr:response regulator [Stellaceae bacterium]